MKHFYQGIKGYFNFQGLYEQMVKEAKDGDRFIEIGIYNGKSTAFMAVEIANSGKKIDFHAIDSFVGIEKDDGLGSPKQREKIARDNLKKVNKYVNIHAMPSIDAAKIVPAPVNFVFIDGGHTYNDVIADIDAWWGKVAVGGVIAGDDWNWPGVQKAVLDRFVAEKVEVLGEGKRTHWYVRG